MTGHAVGTAQPGAVASRSLRGPLAYAISCFLIWGIAYGLLDVLNKHFQEALGVGKAQSTFLQIAYFGAYLTLSIPAGMLLRRAGYKAGILTGLCLTAFGAFLFIPSASAASFPLFVGSMFVLASGLCVLETSADTYVNVLGDPAGAARRLNLAQSFNALGVFFGPLIGGSLFFGRKSAADAEISVQFTYAVIGVAVLLFAFAIYRARLPEIAEPEHASVGGPETLARRHFILGVVTQFLYVGAQVGVGALFINLAVETWPGMTSRQGAFLLSVGLFGYLVGRFFTTALLARFSPRRILTIYGLANTLLCLIVLTGVQKVSTIAAIAIFFFMSAMFATIFSLGVADMGPNTKRGASLMVMAIGGGVLVPYPMGLLAERFGTPTAFVIPAMCFALVAFYGWKGAEIHDRAPAK